MSAIIEDDPPPFFVSPHRPPSAWAMLRHAISDPAAVIPASIYERWAIKLPGPVSPVVITHPDDVRRVLLDKGELFGRNRQLRMMMRRAWGRGLAAAQGPDWARQRHAASPAFRPQAVEASVAAMAQVTRRVAAGWPDSGGIELGAAMGRIVAEIVLSTLLTGLDDVDLDRLAADIPGFVRVATTFGLLDLLPVPDAMIDRWRGLGRSDGEQRLRALAARLALLRASPPDVVPDLPALLRGLAPLADNILGFTAAGFETSALAAAWALYLLARHPVWQDALRSEAQAGGDTFPVARRIAQETLRLYPPAPLLARAALAPTTLREFGLRTGQAVIIPVYALHRHRRVWDRPDHFDPDRFGPTASYDRGAYLPFGAGPRLCIAAGFAQTEMAVMISELVKRYRFTPAPVPPHLSLRATTHSTTGIHVEIERLM